MPERHAHISRRSINKQRLSVCRHGPYHCIPSTFRGCETISCSGSVSLLGSRRCEVPGQQQQQQLWLDGLTWLPAPVPRLYDGVMHRRGRVLLLLLLFVVGFILLLSAEAVGAILWKQSRPSDRASKQPCRQSVDVWREEGERAALPG